MLLALESSGVVPPGEGVRLEVDIVDPGAVTNGGGNYIHQCRREESLNQEWLGWSRMLQEDLCGVKAISRPEIKPRRA